MLDSELLNTLQSSGIIDGYEYTGEYRKDGKCWNEEWNASDECLDYVGYIPSKDKGKKLKSFEWIE